MTERMSGGASTPPTLIPPAQVLAPNPLPPGVFRLTAIMKRCFSPRQCHNSLLRKAPIWSLNRKRRADRRVTPPNMPDITQPTPFRVSGCFSVTPTVARAVPPPDVETFVPLAPSQLIEAPQPQQPKKREVDLAPLEEVRGRLPIEITPIPPLPPALPQVEQPVKEHPPVTTLTPTQPPEPVETIESSRETQIVQPPPLQVAEAQPFRIVTETRVDTVLLERVEHPAAESVSQPFFPEILLLLPPREPQESIPEPSPAQPQSYQVHVGLIEVVVTAPEGAISQPQRRSPLTRGFHSAFGLRQG